MTPSVRRQRQMTHHKNFCRRIQTLLPAVRACFWFSDTTGSASLHVTVAKAVRPRRPLKRPCHLQVVTQPRRERSVNAGANGPSGKASKAASAPSRKCPGSSTRLRADDDAELFRRIGKIIIEPLRPSHLIRELVQLRISFNSLICSGPVPQQPPMMVAPRSRHFIACSA